MRTCLTSAYIVGVCRVGDADYLAVLQILLLCSTELTAALLREVLDTREAAASTVARTGAHPTPSPATPTPGHTSAARFRHSQSCGQLGKDGGGGAGEWARHGMGPSTYPGCEGAARPPGTGQSEQGLAALQQEVQQLKVSPGTEALYGSISCISHHTVAGALRRYHWRCPHHSMPGTIKAQPQRHPVMHTLYKRCSHWAGPGGAHLPTPVNPYPLSCWPRVSATVHTAPRSLLTRLPLSANPRPPASSCSSSSATVTHSWQPPT